MLGGYDTPYKVRTPSNQGINYYRINWGNTNKAYTFYVSGCGSSVNQCVDVQLHHGKNVHEGRKLPYHTSIYFAYWYDDEDNMYLELGSYMSVVVSSVKGMTLEHISELPSTATKVTLT